MSSITLTCAGCGTSFEKPTAEVRRQRKKNPDRQFYCTMPCYGRHAGKNNIGENRVTGHLLPGNRQDEFSPFRYYMNKARNRKYDTDLDLPYLKDLWEQQRGRCAISGIGMDLPRNTVAFDRDKGNPWKASLDRIDCSQGYLKGNVRFVVNMANLCRNGFTDEEVLRFARGVVAGNP